MTQTVEMPGPTSPALILLAFTFPSCTERLAPIAVVEYLEAAPAFPSNYGLGMAIAQLDLTNWTTCRINLPEDYRGPVHGASWCSARRRVAASPDLNGRRDGSKLGSRIGSRNPAECVLEMS